MGATSRRRTPLTRGRVVEAAVALADAEGMAALSMRTLARNLEVEPMALYHHVRHKEELLDAMVDVVGAEIRERTTTLPRPDDPARWTAALRELVLTARQVLLRHSWAPGVLETRVTMSPHLVRHFDDVLATMRLGGLSYDLAHHALHALGSRALGFTQELFDPSAGADEQASQAMADLADEVPHLVQMVTQIAHDDPGSTLGWCDDQTEFEFGLDLILDGLQRLAAESAGAGPTAQPVRPPRAG